MRILVFAITAIISRSAFDHDFGPHEKQAARSLQSTSIRFPEPGRSFRRKSPVGDACDSICTNLSMVDSGMQHTS